ncbi:MAG: DNA polymerase sliding clamp [Desulfurococcus sp.]|nr:DNA polymerase sliding clamp [Desulfurococcus sp.]
MFRAVYSNASHLKYIVQAIAKITDEAPLHATPSALEVRVLSPDKSMLTVVGIPASSFEEYSLDGEEQFTVSSMSLNKVMRRGSRNDLVVLELDRSANVLNIMFKDRKTGVERAFQVELLPRIPEPVPDLNLELSVTVKMLVDDYKNMVGDLKAISEEAEFAYQDNKLIVRAVEQQREYIGEYSEGSPLIYLYSTASKARAVYSVDLLAATVKPAAASKHVTISFDSDKPLKVEYELEGGGRITYWIVPRIG